MSDAAHEGLKGGKKKKKKTLLKKQEGESGIKDVNAVRQSAAMCKESV